MRGLLFFESVKKANIKDIFQANQFLDESNMIFEVLDLETGALKFFMPICLLESL